MPVLMVMRAGKFMTMEMAVVVEGLGCARVLVTVAVIMAMGTMLLVGPASHQERPDTLPEHGGPQTYHEQPRHCTQPRVKLVGKDV